MTPEESKRVLDFMKFPYMENMQGYRGLLKNAGLKIETDDYLFPEFSKYVELYLRMLTEQLTSDALKIIGDNMEMFQGLGGEMMFMLELAKAGKMDRCRFVARK
jgi:hypothetical protein